MPKFSLIIVVMFFISTQSAQAQSQLTLSAIEGSLNSDISHIVLKEAYDKLGIALEILPLPGERAIRTSNSGQTDGELFRIANVEKKYPNLVVVPTPINVLQAIAFTKNLTPSPSIVGWESLKAYKIAIQVGIKFAERGTKGMNPILVDTNEQLFKMLDSERVEMVIAAYANGLKTLTKLQLKSINAISPPIQEYPLYHYLHKKHTDLVPQLDQVLQQMQKQGRIQSIREEVLKSGQFQG